METSRTLLKITPKYIGAILGFNPLKSKEGVLKDMILEYLGYRGEFLELREYYYKIERKCTHALYLSKYPCKIHKHSSTTHPLYAALASGDCFLATFSDNTEVLLALSAKNSKATKEYYAALQLQLECTQREAAHSIKWQKGGGIEVDTHLWDRKFIPYYSGELEDFMGLVDSKLKEEEEFYLEALSLNLKQTRKLLKKLKSKEDSLKSDILKTLYGRCVNKDFLQVREIVRRGELDYKAFCVDCNFNIPSKYQKPDKIVKEIRV